MPELPEVEVVKEGLKQIIGDKPRITAVEFLRADLRTPLPHKARAALVGQTVLALHRRAKYIILETENFRVVSHLGMTGSWRLSHDKPGPHDHIVLELSGGQRLVYRDPRRFGVFDIVPSAKFAKDKRFTHLGPEPFSKEFSEDYLFSLSRNKKVPVKNFLMDQRVVVGVGNIYASEALFLSGISPLVQAQKVTRQRYKQLVGDVRKILKKAIAKGGSTIRDFASTGGEDGGYQQAHKVYGRDGEPCRKCGTPIKSQFLAGRNTFWCVKCQK